MAWNEPELSHPTLMPEVTPLSPEQLRSMTTLARTLVAAGRSRALYPPEHPSVCSAVDRLSSALREAGGGQPLAFGVTPDTLLLDDATLPARDGPIAEAAAWLHERDILRLLFLPHADTTALQALLALLAEDPRSVRARGGPATAWAAVGQSAIGIEQIDLSQVLDERTVEHPARRKDDVWRSIVQAVTDRRRILESAVQRRLLEISSDATAIAELAQDVMAPSCAADGSPMLTSQAAAVVAAYRHLVGIVDIMEPDRRTEVMQHLATATASLDSRVVLRMLGGPDDPGAAGGGPGGDVKRSLAGAFDDLQVARLLATTLAIDGRATDRLAEVFGTIAPDEPRRKRVLTLTRSLLSETSFGHTTEFQTLWTSMEHLLLTYDEEPFVSADYRRSLDSAGARAEAMAAGDVPEDLAALVHTLGQENVRRLSVTLLIDLLQLERDQARATELAQDLGALGEDLLLAGDYDAALRVTTALAEQAGEAAAVARQGCRLALDSLAATPAFLEAAEYFGEMGESEAAVFGRICDRIGPAAAETLSRWLDVEELTPAGRRAADIIRGYGVRAVSRLAPLVGSPHWYARRHAADLLGRIGAREAVPLLQPLLRGGDPRVTQAAVRALSSIDDPAAARAVHTVLRAATGGQRQAVIAALVAGRDPRVAPVLVRILEDSNPFGADHALVLETLGAIGSLGHDHAVPHVEAMMKRRRWLARRKTHALKRASLDALRAIGSPRADAAIAGAKTHGDRLLRKLAGGLGGRAHG